MKIIKASTFLLVTLISLISNPVTAASVKVPTVAAPNTTQLTHQEILTHILTAELALQRDMPEVALDNYMLVTQATHDPQVAQLATELAIQLQSTGDALAASEIWANADKKDLQAQLVALTLFVNSSPKKAMTFLSNAYDIKDPDIDQNLLLIISRLSPNGQKNLTKAVFDVADERPNDAYAQLTAAQVAAAQLDIEPATTKLAQALKLQPDLTTGIELKAKLIRHEKNADQPALDYLAQQVNKYPKNNDLRSFYIAALMDNNLDAKAIPQLEILAKDPDVGGEALITLSEIYMKNKNTAATEAALKKALNFPVSVDKASYYLGQLAEIKNDNQQAIKWYEKVSEDSEFQVPAYLRAAYLYSLDGNYTDALNTLQNSSPTSFFDQKQVLLTEIDILMAAKDYEQALDNCNQAIAVLPDDVDFLYARSLVYGLMKKDKEAEKDLRAILAVDPNNANALNALGFTLANQPSRINEAMPLLQKAISLNPDNPAFMDSMGWLLFKMGKTQESIDMLTNAYKMSGGDNEIAAHLGEVLWTNGKQEAARDIWSKAMLASPTNQQTIIDTMTRLKVPDMKMPTPNNKIKAAN